MDALQKANEAYRCGMPPLWGYENICNFIACLGYALQAGIVKPENGSQLFYAAQVAMSTVANPAQAPDLISVL